MSLIRKRKEQYYNNIAGILILIIQNPLNHGGICASSYNGKTNNHSILTLINGDNVITNDTDNTVIFILRYRMNIYACIIIQLKYGYEGYGQFPLPRA